MRQLVTPLLAALVLVPLSNARAQDEPLTQVAVVVDVSGSVRGFEQRILEEVRSFVQSQKPVDRNAKLEVAVVLYGRDKTYVKTVEEFTRETDKALGTLEDHIQQLSGGGEGCGYVLEDVYNLPWSQHEPDRRIVLIVGNESFLQGRPNGHTAIRDHQKDVDARPPRAKPTVVHVRYVGPKKEGMDATDWRRTTTLTPVQKQYEATFGLIDLKP